VVADGSVGSCPGCGAAALAPWRAVPAGEPWDSRLFELLRCSACGSAVTAGPPPGAEAYSSGVYAPGAPRAAGVLRRLQRLLDRQPSRLLRRGGLARGARVLDAGAGRGRLVESLAAAGFDARGIDPAPRMESARVQRAEIVQHSESELDAVVLWHVLEHLDDPLAALHRVASWLRPGGVVLVGVPNLASLQAAVGGPGWLHLDVPRHRSHFTARGLAVLLRRAGLEPVASEHLVWEHNPGAMWMALLSRAGMTPGFPFHLLKRNVPARPRDLALLALGLPLIPVAVALEALAARSGRGGTVAVVARRVA
jgi:SAM-dependent methyltransferase